MTTGEALSEGLEVEAGWERLGVQALQLDQAVGGIPVGPFDPTGRLWGTDNIWLAGNGLLNGWSACNPTLTTVALALRTADAIASR